VTLSAYFGLTDLRGLSVRRASRRPISSAANPNQKSPRPVSLRGVRRGLTAIYLKRRLPRPLPTKDGGILYTIKDVRSYVLALPGARSERRYWQRACQLLRDQADVVTLRRKSSWRCSATPNSATRRATTWGARVASPKKTDQEPTATALLPNCP
jgi:hypothetical protein